MLRLVNISKSFPGVRALEEIYINFDRGSVHALLGENGAGKSTLIKIISGLYKPDKGKIYFNRDIYNVKNPREALTSGIHTVYQELRTIPQSSVGENIMIDKLPTIGRTGFVDWKKVNKISKRYLNMIGLDLSPTISIKKISIAQRQLVEIAKALSSDVKVLLLDEPTSALTQKEADSLFSVINNLKRDGVLIIFVTHILEEVFKICDKVSILRDGSCIKTDEIKNLSRKEIVKLMIGRDENTRPLGVLNRNNKKVLEIRNLTSKRNVNNISLNLYKGEILGFYGLVGSGRTELAKIIIGLEKYDSGDIYLYGKKSKIKNVYYALKKYKLGYVSEDRRKDGLIMNDSVKTNICITIWDKLINKIKIISQKKEEIKALEQVNSLDIKITGLRQQVGNLSGGNQQKVNIAKWLAADVDILIFDEPTTGVDVGAKEYITKLIWNLAKRGKSVILISSDMPEMIKLSSRILVFHENKIIGEIDNESKNYKEISNKIMNYIAKN
jgi:ribose transport system ATP-binding protein